MKKSLSRFLVFILAALPLLSCGQDANNRQKLTATEFNQQLKSGENIQLIDVRTPEEFGGGHLVNAKNVDYNADNFEQAVSTLDKSKPSYVYCLSGGRSAAAADYMRKSGFAHVYELKGGILAWKNSGLPITSTDAAPKADKFTKSDFDQMITHHKVVLVDFYAPWCTPCTKMKPSLEHLTELYSGKALVYRLNIEEAKSLADEMKIGDIPLFHLYKDGKLVKVLHGYQEESTLNALIKGAL